MKRLLCILWIICLLPMGVLAEMTIEATENGPYALGDVVKISINGAEGDVCRYQLHRDGKEVFAGAEVPVFGGILHPRKTGEYTLTVQCGEEEAAFSFAVEENVSVQEAAQGLPSASLLRIEASRSTVMRQGDAREVTVYSDGPWTAQTDSDFILLSKDCGISGDSLVMTVLPTSEDRQGQVLFQSGKETVSLPVHQVNAHITEEEISFAPVEDWLRIDGAGVQACFLTEEAAFFVEASGAWTWDTDGDFFTVTKTEDGLMLRPETQADTLKKACITLSCGRARAYLYVYQLPEEKGAAVLDAAIGLDTVTAYDAVIANVTVSPDTEKLTVSAPGYTEVFPAEMWAKETEESLFFQVDIPLKEEGEQMILFAAENGEGSGKKQKCLVTVVPEEAAFACEEAVFTAVGSRRDIAFLTTKSAQSVTLTDAAGASLGTFSSNDGQVLYAGQGYEKERYLLWMLPVPQGNVPAFAEVENSRIPVKLRTVLTPEDIELYSQTDGFWQDKKYSISQLEQSGCAVFALSHAMQLLGYSGEEIRPESLAKTYPMALMKDGSGTMNSTLVGRAGDDFGFKTRYELYENKQTIIDKAAQGAVFTFSVVSGHIACIAEVLPEENLCMVIDSAPLATFERKGMTPVYYRLADGHFAEAITPADIPGTEYCLETNSYGCAVYYMTLDYAAKRGVRLIQPQ